MKIPVKTTRTIGCLNLTHYSFCRYCTHNMSKRNCNLYREKYNRNIELTESTPLYRKMISYDFGGLDLISIDYSDKVQVDEIINVLRARA